MSNERKEKDPRQEEAIRIDADELEEHSPEQGEGDSGQEDGPRGPEEEIAALREELDTCKDRLLRLAAEQENFKKRMERERDNLLKYAGENILRELLDTVDNLERALEEARREGVDPAEAFHRMMEGVELTRKGLLSTLEKFEVTPLEAVGAPFDPEKQEALSMEESDEVPQGHVIREFMRGYHFKDRLLRPARVIVSNGPAKE